MISQEGYGMEVRAISHYLWSVVRENRFLFKVLMDAAIAVINDTISSKYRNRRLVAGSVVVLHPFSKNMGFNPNLHVLVTEGGFDKKGNFVHQKYPLQKAWYFDRIYRIYRILMLPRILSIL